MIHDLILAGLGSGGLYCLMATGFALIYRPTHQLHIAYGVLALSGGYLLSSFTKQLGLSEWLGIPLAVLAAAALGIVVERVLYGPVSQNGLNVLLTSFGVVFIGQAIYQWAYGPGSVTPDSSPAWSHEVNLGFGSMTWVQFTLLLAAVAIGGGVASALRWTTMGRALTALSTNRDLAITTGLPVNGVTSLCYALGTGIAALGACLQAIDVGVRPTGSVSLVLTAFVGAVVFGQRIALAPLGGFAVGFLITAMLYFVSGEYQTMSVYICLIVLLFARSGISRLVAESRRRSYVRAFVLAPDTTSSPSVIGTDLVVTGGRKDSNQ